MVSMSGFIIGFTIGLFAGLLIKHLENLWYAEKKK